MAYVKFGDLRGVNGALGMSGTQCGDDVVTVERVIDYLQKKKKNADDQEVVLLTEEERRERNELKKFEVENLSKTQKGISDSYTTSIMANSVIHLPRVPSSYYKKSLKNKIKKGGDVFEVSQQARKRAADKLKKQYFEKDDLLKIRREKRKMKKFYNIKNSKNVHKQAPKAK